MLWTLLGYTHIPSSVELTSNLESGVDEYDDSMVAQDDNSNSPALLEQGTEECRQPEPFCMRNELNETIGQSRRLSGYVNEEITANLHGQVQPCWHLHLPADFFPWWCKGSQELLWLARCPLEKTHKMGFPIPGTPFLVPENTYDVACTMY